MSHFFLTDDCFYSQAKPGEICVFSFEKRIGVCSRQFAYPLNKVPAGNVKGGQEEGTSLDSFEIGFLMP